MTHFGLSRRLWTGMVLATCFALSTGLVGHSHGAIMVNCDELVANGGFEAGAVDWTQASAGGYELVSQFNPRTGMWGAYLAGINNADDRLGQVVIVPSQALTVTLQLWWSIATEETVGVFDSLTVALYRPDGSLLEELAVLDNTAPANAWDMLSADLTAYAGQTLRLSFQAETDESNPTDFYIDDVSMTACVGSPGPADNNRIYLPLITLAG